jgi:hypothetical protein
MSWVVIIELNSKMEINFALVNENIRNSEASTNEAIRLCKGN